MRIQEAQPKPARAGVRATRVIGAPLARWSVGARQSVGDSDLLLAGGIACVAVGLLAMLPRSVFQDTWLALLAGRDVARSGIPWHETLTAFSHGRAWVDQQWLSQLFMYWTDRVGGLPLLGVMNVGLLVGGVSGAVVAARRLGAAANSINRVLPIALGTILVATEVRTQGYAYPLFVVTLYLLASDSRKPSRSVYWCLPLLVLWGNLHGSASLGAGLVMLRGLTLVWERRRQLTRVQCWLRPAVLLVGSPVCLLITPYGLSMASYYRATLLNSAFRKFTTEWQPVTAVPVVAGVFFVLAAITVWSFGRYPRQTTLWERCALIAVAVAAIIAIRNVEWFGLTALMLLPLSIDAAVRSNPQRGRSRRTLNLALAGTAVVVLALVLGATLLRPASSFERPYPDAAAAAVNEVAADRSVRVYADEKFADWLLWEAPALHGRVAYDARFELLSTEQLGWIATLKLIGAPDWKRAARGYRLVVLDQATTTKAITAFEREPGRRIVYAHAGVVVILRSAAEASH
jgi:hypothetical protein